ncbi:MULTISPECIES: hypothetical protein [unclassified Aureispira]|uniref:hypothetical protein n=1 Tax=unclassified Aureispira TaxID=2649989 RepID=UPI0006968377|nr:MULTISPECIES: hypothetical protein [unclassified Aureispira]WMX15487.1 hypothetical protein QP953_03740 [Aureispira sp. CCB-E]
MSKLIFILLFAISLKAEALPTYPVNKIQQGELLNKAKASSLDDFFESWMDRNVKKAMEGSWIVLYKNEEFLYWGWTTFESMVSANPTVKEFFKTPMADIQAKFPNYESVHGNSIREKLEIVIAKSIPQKATVTVILGFKVQLIDETLVIQTPCTIKIPGEDSEKANYNVILNRDTLDLIKLEPL